MATGFEERRTVSTLIKWKPSELRQVSQFCTDIGLDRASFIRGIMVAVTRPGEGLARYHSLLTALPDHVAERLMNYELPFVTDPEEARASWQAAERVRVGADDRKPAKEAKSPRKRVKARGHR